MAETRDISGQRQQILPTSSSQKLTAPQSLSATKKPAAPKIKDGYTDSLSSRRAQMEQLHTEGKFAEAEALMAEIAHDATGYASLPELLFSASASEAKMIVAPPRGPELRAVPETKLRASPTLADTAEVPRKWRYLGDLINDTARHEEKWFRTCGLEENTAVKWIKDSNPLEAKLALEKKIFRERLAITTRLFNEGKYENAKKAFSQTMRGSEKLNREFIEYWQGAGARWQCAATSAEVVRNLSFGAVTATASSGMTLLPAIATSVAVNGGLRSVGNIGGQAVLAATTEGDQHFSWDSLSQEALKGSVDGLLSGLTSSMGQGRTIQKGFRWKPKRNEFKQVAKNFGQKTTSIVKKTLSKRAFDATLSGGIKTGKSLAEGHGTLESTKKGLLAAGKTAVMGGIAQKVTLPAVTGKLLDLSVNATTSMIDKAIEAKKM